MQRDRGSRWWTGEVTQSVVLFLCFAVLSIVAKGVYSIPKENERFLRDAAKQWMESEWVIDEKSILIHTDRRSGQDFDDWLEEHDEAVRKREQR